MSKEEKIPRLHNATHMMTSIRQMDDFQVLDTPNTALEPTTTALGVSTMI
jgi:hypothetical protein